MKKKEKGGEKKKKYIYIYIYIYIYTIKDSRTVRLLKQELATPSVQNVLHKL